MRPEPVLADKGLPSVWELEMSAASGRSCPRQVLSAGLRRGLKRRCSVIQQDRVALGPCKPLLGNGLRGFLGRVGLRAALVRGLVLPQWILWPRFRGMGA
jgi:hypothetical protein